MCLFFKQKTAYEMRISDWSSDVCSSDLTDFVSGNNDADAVLLLQWVEERLPEHRDRLEGMLRAWGGNASGSGIANIDNIGDVHPDTYWWQHTVGHVRRQDRKSTRLNPSH